MAADTESQNKLNAALRYGGTTAGTLFTVMGVMSLLSPDQITQLGVAVHDLNASILTAYGALTKMWVILGPVGVVILGRAGFKSSSVQAMAAKLFKIATNDNDPAQKEAKVALVNAAASPDIGSQGVVNKDLAADPATSGNVVAAPELLPPKAA